MRWLIVEFDLHPHRPKRLDEMRNVGQHETGMVWVKNYLRCLIERSIP